MAEFLKKSGAGPKNEPVPPGSFFRPGEEFLRDFAQSRRNLSSGQKNEPGGTGSFSGPAPDFFGDFAKFPTNSQPATKNEPGGTGSFFRVGVGIRCEVAQHFAGARNPVNSDSASTAIFDFSNVCTHPGANVTNRYESLLAHFPLFFEPK